MNLALQLALNGLVTGLLFALLACGFGLVYRSLRVFHIAYAGLVLVAPYAAHAAHSRTQIGLAASVVFGVGCGALAGLMLEKMVYGPFSRRRAASGATLVASMGVAALLQNLLILAFGNEVQVFDRPPATRFTLGPVALSSLQLLQATVAAATLAALVIAARRHIAFKAIWAMGDEPGLIPVLGLPERRYRALVMLFSAALGGLAACLLAVDVGVDPNIGMSYMLAAAVAVLVGGVERLRGWILGGLLLALLQGMLVWALSPKWIDLATFGVLIAVLALRPGGVLDPAKRLEET
jgi:branched-chain amino acid transport system permease protein